MNDRLTLEDLKRLWKDQLEQAERQLAAARSEAQRIERELRESGIPSPDIHYAYQKALRAETFALEKYAKVLTIYNDLVLHGTAPEEQAG